MNGLPLVFGSTALLASFALVKRGSRGWHHKGEPKGFYIPDAKDSPDVRLKSSMFSYAPIDIAAIRDRGETSPHFEGDEATVQGTLIVNGTYHHLMAIRVWDGLDREEDKEFVEELLKEYFPDVPAAIRRMVNRKSIREAGLSPAEKEWLELARTDHQVPVRDPYNRLETQARAAYGDPDFLESTTIPGFPGRWVIIMYPHGD